MVVVVVVVVTTTMVAIQVFFSIRFFFFFLSTKVFAKALLDQSVRVCSWAPTPESL